jgi:hypothetical protein
MLNTSDYEVTSDATRRYNCVAYAADDYTRKWGCSSFLLPGYYWPPGAIVGVGIDAITSAFGMVGYTVCEDRKPEPEFEKIAIYTDNHGQWTHAAKLRDDGHWSSKLGDWEDIRHATLESLEHSDYGRAVRYMKRPREKSIAPA